ncbi:unnamed protein product [Symbiodinium sp. CCMP2592]|nr:unnamed protein product [Symbiodinium sp. CCMP2592]
MEFSALPAVEAGAVELLEFSWPLAPDPEEEEQTCIAYVLMKRAAGFIVCLPCGFLPEAVVQEGQQNDGADGLGPSLELTAPAVRLGQNGDWSAAELEAAVPAMVIDMPASAASAFARPDLSAFGGVPFVQEDPGLFPLASDVLRQTQEWADAFLHDARSGYQTAVEDLLPLRPKGPKAKRHTVATLAQEQANLQELVRGLADQLADLLPQGAAGSNSLAQGPAAPPPGLGTGEQAQVHAQVPASRLAAPLATVLPPSQHVPKALSHVIGPPPPTRQAPKQPSSAVDLEQQLADTIGGGDPPQESSALASAVLAQSQALVSLVSQRSEARPAARSFNRTFSAGMDPSGLITPDHPTMIRYLERYGNYGKQRSLGLMAWMVALAGDQLARGAPESCSDTIALLQLMIEQANLDSGDFTFAWILALQADPPGSLYQDVAGSPSPAAKAFSPLAEQKWVTIALSFLKEVEVITARRAEVQPPPKKAPQGPPPTEVPKGPKAGEEALTKKQQRAAAWAAKRAAQAKLVLKSGTAFGHFLRTTLPLRRDASLGVATALFPLPLPAEGVFQKRSRRRPSKRRLPHLVSVVLHVMVMALNFLHADGKHIPPVCLRRPPSSLQTSAFLRLRELIKACARLGGTTLTSGRRGLQLAARHAELVAFIRASGLDLDGYAKGGGRAGPCPSAAVVPLLPGGPAELAPYRDIDASRRLAA